MSSLIIALIAGTIIGFSFDNVTKLIPNDITIKPDTYPFLKRKQP